MLQSVLMPGRRAVPTAPDTWTNSGGSAGTTRTDGPASTSAISPWQPISRDALPNSKQASKRGPVLGVESRCPLTCH